MPGPRPQWKTVHESTQQKIDEAFKELTDIKDAAQKVLNDITEKQNTAQTRVDNITEKQNAAQTKIDKITQKQGTAQTTLDNMIEKQNAAQTTLDDITTKQNAAQTTLNDITKKQNAAQTTLNDITKKQNNTQTISDDITGKQSTVNEAFGQIEQILGRSKEIEGNQKQRFKDIEDKILDFYEGEKNEKGEREKGYKQKIEQAHDRIEIIESEKNKKELSSAFESEAKKYEIKYRWTLSGMAICAFIIVGVGGYAIKNNITFSWEGYPLLLTMMGVIGFFLFQLGRSYTEQHQLYIKYTHRSSFAKAYTAYIREARANSELQQQLLKALTETIQKEPNSEKISGNLIEKVFKKVEKVTDKVIDKLINKAKE